MTMKKRKTGKCQTGSACNAESNATMLSEMASLSRMTVAELKTKWEALFSVPAPNNSRSHLELRIGHRIQELALGGPARESRRALDLLADEAQGGNGRKAIVSDPRKPAVGTRLVREWDGVEHTVVVLKDGFDWQGRKFKSLSAAAREITGTRWNGFRFFGLS